MNRDLLEIQGLSVVFRGRRGSRPVRAVDGVSLSVSREETVGVVGESGSGKTTLGLAVVGLRRPSSGAVRFQGEDLSHARRARRRQLSRHVQMVFQDPYGSLSPTRTVGQTLVEPLAAHGLFSPAERRHRAAAMLERVGMPEEALDRYPSEFSGGQRQRVAIARALMPEPELVVCDEPVSALDLSVQAQVLNLLRRLQRELRLSYLFVGHNLAVVRYMSHRVVVMYRGRVMEVGPAENVYRGPAHPYTQMLVEAAPLADPASQRSRRPRREAISSVGMIVDGPGCPFAPRCAFAVEACRQAAPPLVATPSGTQAACVRVGEIPPYRANGSSRAGRESLPLVSRKAQEVGEATR